MSSPRVTLSTPSNVSISSPPAAPRSRKRRAGGEDAPFEGAHGAVVGVDALREVPPHLREMAGEDPQPLVEDLAEVADRPRVLLHLLLPPAVGHGPQERDQGRGRREDHPLLHPVFDEAGVLLQRRAEEGLARQEEDHELRRRLELAPVALLGELLEVHADPPRMLHQPLTPPLLIPGLQSVQIGVERRLGVDHHALAAGQADHQIGALPAVVRVDRGLGGEVAVGEHAGHLDDALELDFSPAAARRRSAQGSDELDRFALQARLRRAEALQVLGEPGVGGGARRLQVLDLAVHLVERLAERGHQLADRLLPPLQVPARRLLEPLQRRLGQVQERRVVPLERLGGESLERVPEPRLGFVQKTELLRRALPFMLQRGLQARQPLASHQPGHGGSSGENREDQRNRGEREFHESFDLFSPVV